MRSFRNCKVLNATKNLLKIAKTNILIFLARILRIILSHSQPSKNNNIVAVTNAK